MVISEGSHRWRPHARPCCLEKEACSTGASSSCCRGCMSTSCCNNEAEAKPPPTRGSKQQQPNISKGRRSPAAPAAASAGLAGIVLQQSPRRTSNSRKLPLLREVSPERVLKGNGATINPSCSSTANRHLPLAMQMLLPLLLGGRYSRTTHAANFLQQQNQQETLKHQLQQRQGQQDRSSIYNNSSSSSSSSKCSILPPRVWWSLGLCHTSHIQ